MKKAIEKKYTDGPVLDVDEEKRMVKIAIASLGDLDRDGDVFDEKAFNKTIASHGPAGTNEVWHLMDHGYKIRDAALSKPKELFVENRKVVMVSPYRDTWNWREMAWPLYVGKDITQHSVGFTTNDSEQKQEYRLIKEVTLWEGSCVLWGANKNTPTLEVVKSWIEAKENEEPINQRFDRLYKAIKEEKYNDDNRSLLKIEFKYLEQYIVDLQEKANQSSDKKVIDAADEQAKQMNAELLDALKQFNHKFKV